MPINPEAPTCTTIFSSSLQGQSMRRRFSIMSSLPKRAFAQRDESGFRIKRQQIDSATKIGHGELTIQEEMTEGASYKIDGDLRRVPPYYFTYLTFCKERWRDRKLLDIFTTEFRDRDEAYYKKAIESGQVYLNKKQANLNSIVRNGNLISHRTHKHEPPVTARKIGIVYEDDQLVVVDKPSGMPVHPTGRYRFNTVVKVLEHEQGKKVHPCNRLDRLTSGLMFLAKNSKGADKMGTQLRGREVRKEYLARVVGEFPLEEIICDKSLTTFDPRVALNRVDPKGKEAKTVFNRISFDGQTSIVRCKPLTGRTHQIRVHLQYLGYPIANDPVYSNLSIWGESLGKDGEGNPEEIAAQLDRVGKDKTASSWYYREEDGERLTGGKCETCETALYTDPGPNDLDLWLHALKYYAEDGSWSYQTEIPDWALESHVPMMERALQEAKKCGPTETAFCVGAVLVKDGNILETGYSRELPGNTHAEQCALEKYRANHDGQDVPEGTVIYTTMEPCSERLSGNLPCVDRIIECKNIKTVFVGVLEPDTFIAKNVSRQKLRAAQVEYIHVPGMEEECLATARYGHKE